MYYKELADTVNYFKTTKEGEANMTSVIEIYAENKAKEAVAKAEKQAAKKVAKATKKAAEKTVHQRNIEIAKDMLAEGMSIEVTARISKLSEEEVRELPSTQSA